MFGYLNLMLFLLFCFFIAWYEFFDGDVFYAKISIIGVTTQFFIKDFLLYINKKEAK